VDPPVVPLLRCQRRPPQVHALAYNLGNFMRTLAMPKTAEPWSLISLREKLIKIGASRLTPRVDAYCLFLPRAPSRPP
jgi:hypothetical protein